MIYSDFYTPPAISVLAWQISYLVACTFIFEDKIKHKYKSITTLTEKIVMKSEMY